MKPTAGFSPSVWNGWSHFWRHYNKKDLHSVRQPWCITRSILMPLSWLSNFQWFLVTKWRCHRCKVEDVSDAAERTSRLCVMLMTLLQLTLKYIILVLLHPPCSLSGTCSTPLCWGPRTPHRVCLEGRCCGWPELTGESAQWTGVDSRPALKRKEGTDRQSADRAAAQVKSLPSAKS